MLFKYFLKSLIKEEKRILGRWNIDYKKKNLEYKIYLANYDHCGPCGKIKIKENTN